MAMLFVLLVLMGFIFLLSGARDICHWIFQKNELRSVKHWNKFRDFGEENRK